MRVGGAVAVLAAVMWGIATHLIGAACAGPIEDGEAAYDRGDYAAALKIWTPLAERADPRAENWLGVLYHDGYGVTQDDRTAAAWYRRAAEHGYAAAQFNLAAEYVIGQGVPRDDAEAARWFGAAAARSYVPAERELGTLYYEGRGVARDLQAALKWWRAAAAAGDATAAQAMQQALAADEAARAEAARRDAVRKAELPEQLKHNKRVNYWRLWQTGCFDYVAADNFFETAPRSTVRPQRNCCPGAVTIKAVEKNPDGVATNYLVAFAAKPGGYCPVQFFGGWVDAGVMER